MDNSKKPGNYMSLNRIMNDKIAVYLYARLLYCNYNKQIGGIHINIYILENIKLSKKKASYRIISYGFLKLAKKHVL